jgi:hypothetical protein
MGMFYLKNPAMLKDCVFPKDFAKALCVDYMCKGLKCANENCPFAHPRQPKDIEMSDI